MRLPKCKKNTKKHMCYMAKFKNNNVRLLYWRFVCIVGPREPVWEPAWGFYNCRGLSYLSKNPVSKAYLGKYVVFSIENTIYVDICCLFLSNICPKSYQKASRHIPTISQACPQTCPKNLPRNLPNPPPNIPNIPNMSQKSSKHVGNIFKHSDVVQCSRIDEGS